MSDKLDDARFWLPSEFLTEEDIVMDSYGVLGSSRSLNLAPELGIKHGFFTPSTGSISPVESTETVSEEEGDSLGTELTQLLTLLRASRLTKSSQNHESFTGSGLPDFTGLKNGSGGYNSPSYGPPRPNFAPGSGTDEAWDLIYKAAAKSNVGSGFGFGSGFLQNPNRFDPQSVLPPRNSHSLQQLSRAEMLLELELRRTEEKIRLNFEKSYRKTGGVSDSITGGGFNSFPYANNQGYGFGLGYGSGAGIGGAAEPPVKSERVGTGVFLPRRYGTGAGVTSGKAVRPARQKLGCGSFWVQADKANPGLNTSSGGSYLQSQTRLVGGGLVGENGMPEAVARRAAISTLQKTFPEGAAASVNRDVCLPQEWTY